ncbi:MAG: AAA domain-containing protein [Methanosarcinales archaeon]|nr:AAA domain-containing protein [Methanosarcinales archaeon]
MSSGHYVAMGLEDPASFMQFTGKGIGPFTFYLKNVIDALQKKEVSCTWEVLERDSFILEPLTRLYEVCPETLIELEPPETGWYQVEPISLEVDEQFDPNPKEPLLIGRGRNATKIELHGDDFRQSATGKWQLRLGNRFEYVKPVTWTGYELSLKPLVNPLESQKHDFRLHGNKIKSRRENNSWRFWLQTDLDPEQSLEVNGTYCSYRVIRRFDKADFQNRFPDALSSGPVWKICNQDKPQYSCANIIDITKNEMSKFSVQELQSNGNPLPKDDWVLRKEKDGTLRLLFSGSDDSIPKELRHVNIPNWCLSCRKQKINEKWIQLQEPDDADEYGASGSILDYFFDENVKLRDNKDKFGKDGELHVLKRRPEERQLLLAHKNYGPSALPRSSELYVQVDVGQVISQRKTAFQLLDQPFPEHRPLLELFKPRNQHHWPIFNSEPEGAIEWQVLTDLDFNGCNYQREFVCKALATPDFAILDGPPGTGKTTTILELILQLVQRGKRVLLAASTHAAINNVLERLQDGGYTEKVHATRVGLEDRAAGLETFVFDIQVEEWQTLLDINENNARQLVMQSANLVCGTTMGLHGLVRNKGMNLDLECNGPPFDVMIIDECSKTTFHEFLVPARLAKRWILVGDVRQLSPFTDREQITANLDNLIIERNQNKSAPLPSDLQEACKLLQILHPYLDKLIIPVQVGVIQELRNEIHARQHDKEYKKPEELNRILLIDEPDPNIESWYDHSTIIIENSALEKNRDCMPMDAIILETGWLQTAHASRHCARNEWYSGHTYRHRGKVQSNANDVYKHAHDNIRKKWSEEICWRLEREYWLRFINNDTGKLRNIVNQLKHLFPHSINATGHIYKLRNIAFPSILESLSGDGMVKRKVDEPTTLNQGFNNDERRCRHTTLNYQHRMHPDISELPRELFYSSKGKQARSLLDGNHVLEHRNWSYPHYATHSEWLDVNGHVNDNANEAEAKAICHELELFCKWAKQNPKDDGEGWDVAVLTFYKGQEKCLRDNLRNLTGDQTKYSRFEKDGVNIKLATVDFFQGQEADLVFLSMVNTYRDGFLDSPNRLNVAITRARYQLVIVGYLEYFSERSTAELKALAKRSKRM